MAIDMEKVCIVADASDDMLVPDLGQHGPAESFQASCFHVISSLSGPGFSPSSAVLARLDKRASLGPGLGCIKAQQAPLRLVFEEMTAKPKLTSALTLASPGPLFQQAGKGPCEGVDVAGPPCRNIVAVLHDKGRPRVVHGIALQGRGLSPV